MSLDELAALKARVELLEDLIAGPPPDCQECIVPMFPRVNERDGTPWRPGLVYSEEARACLDAAYQWEHGGCVGPQPAAPLRYYRKCTSCLGSGVKAETNDEREQRVNAAIAEVERLRS